MFARRRPKPEEEPLVPHGLVWHATGDPSETREKPATPAVPPASESSFERPREEAEPPSTAAKLAHADVPWPTTDEAQPDTAEPAVAIPAQTLPVPLHPQIPPESGQPRRNHELVGNIASSVAGVSRGISTTKEALAVQFLQRGSPGFSRASAGLKRLEGGLRHGYQRSLEFRRNLAVPKDIAVGRMREPGSQLHFQLRPIVERLKFGAAARAAASIESFGIRMRRILAERKAGHHAGVSPSYAVIRNRFAQYHRHGRIFLARAKAEWMLTRQGFARESRLWRSMAMSGICALLTLGFISTVRHYATESLPSRNFFRIMPPSAAIAPKPATSQPTVPALVRAAPQPVKPVADERQPPKVAGGMTKSRPKTRRTEDDGYVARDTYVYYGNGSNKSH